MEIAIKAQCPNCKEDIVFRHESKVIGHESKEDAFNKEAPIADPFFNIMKQSTLKQSDFFDDLYKIVGKETVKAPGLPKSVRLIQNYFDNLRFQIKTTDDPSELLKISNKLAKSKVVASKDVRKEISKHKPRVLALIKKKVKQLNNSKRKK